MKSYSLKIQVRNNHLLSIMRINGFDTAAELSRATGVSQGIIGQFLNLSVSAVMKTGEWKPSLIKLADFLRVTPDMLIPPQHVEAPLHTNRAEMEMSMVEAMQLTSLTGTADELTDSTHTTFLESERTEGLHEFLATRITEREERVIRYRFGLDGEKKTYDQIGKLMGLTRERIRQIEKKGLARMRSAIPRESNTDRICGLLTDWAQDQSIEVATGITPKHIH
ncbi:MAG: hypothetical protein HQL72_02525 [Magnetococcales bacterium]|nr:hypothetical protein [Magnetococcales bacterium]